MEQRICDTGLENWEPSHLPDLTGQTYVITGANSGIGFQAARMLGEKGADIVLACRSWPKAKAAQRKLAAQVKGKVDLVIVDLSDLSSVRKAALELRASYQRIDALINNAGIMMAPQEKTIDGFDLQMGANHLGHFLWTGLLIDLVEAAAGRVVVLSSLVHKYNPLDFDDFMTDKDYTPMKAYKQSKLANLMFAFDLARRLKNAGSKATCVACHPGFANTNLKSTGPRGFAKATLAITSRLAAQSPKSGAIPTVLAAAGNEAMPGAYYGPQNMRETRGAVGDAMVAEHALDRVQQSLLWAKCEELVGLKWSPSGSVGEASNPR